MSEYPCDFPDTWEDFIWKVKSSHREYSDKLDELHREVDSLQEKVAFLTSLKRMIDEKEAERMLISTNSIKITRENRPLC